jgi:UDP-2-acetamido-2,6-beta-L-arabino-hexul-4-ose reductase
MKLIIGITGSSGFIGSYLFNFLKLKENVELVSIEDDYFEQDEMLRNSIRKCDVILHFAAVNRHQDERLLFETNVLLVKKLIAAMNAEQARPHLFISSSIQEERDNPYGRSKKIGRELMAAWARERQANFTGLIIPNVFGPFGLPFYNSVIATFSHQLTHNESPSILKDDEVKLIYVDELAGIIWKLILEENNDDHFVIQPTSICKVSDLLKQLLAFKNQYLDNGTIPLLKNEFDRDLFNTFRSFIDHKSHFPSRLVKHSDDRGFFSELVKSSIAGQFSYSSTKPGITRGNHFHTRKIERFIVISGKAQINLRRVGKSNIDSFDLDGSSPSFVDIPVWYTHNIINIGNEDLVTLFWINEFYDPDDPDTYFETV